MSTRRRLTLVVRPAVFAASTALFILCSATIGLAQDGDPDRPVITGHAANPVAATDVYLKLPDIDGESADHEHEDWIDVLSIDWGTTPESDQWSRAVRRPGDPRRVRADSRTMSMTKTYDASSPDLALACAKGEHIASVIIEAPGSRAEGSGLMRYELTDVIITSYSLDASGDRPTETIAFNYTKVEGEKIPDSEAGKLPPQWGAIRN